MDSQRSLFGDEFAYGPEALRQPAPHGGRPHSVRSNAPGRRGEPVRPVIASEQLQQLARQLPPNLRLGTSSWSFPGWQGLVYAQRRLGRPETEERLARGGLAAYAAHPLFRAVSLDRTFYAPLGVEAFAGYAADVPDDFRFIVKAPAAVTDPVIRRPGSARPVVDNPSFLDAAVAREAFVRPAVDGLGRKAGALVFQFPPLGRQRLAQPGRMISRIAAFLTALPRGPVYAVEVRDPALACPALARSLRDVGAVACLAIHARMPPIAEQSQAFAASIGVGPLIVRWNLHAGRAYEDARDDYHPFNRLVEEDVPTRLALGELVMKAVAEGREAIVTINNKAEGSAPLSVERLAEACAGRRPGMRRSGGVAGIDPTIDCAPNEPLESTDIGDHGA